MGQISEAGIVLEICPTSNLPTQALPDEQAVRDTFRTFAEHGVPFTMATDGPEMRGGPDKELVSQLGATRTRWP
jgi:adenosine deaminase